MAKLKDLAVSLTPFIANTPDRSATLLTQSTSASAISTNLCSWLTCPGSCSLIRHQPLSVRCGFERFSPLEAAFCVRLAAEASPSLGLRGQWEKADSTSSPGSPYTPLAQPLAIFLLPTGLEHQQGSATHRGPSTETPVQRSTQCWYSHCTFQLFALSF